MLDLTYTLCLLGAGIFLIGVYGHTTMNIRVQGRINMLRPLPNLTQRYRLLVKEEGAPLWPLILGTLCMPVGAIVAFGAMFLVRR
jgi:hypothetical protein